jgi:hypothetical protein
MICSKGLFFVEKAYPAIFNLMVLETEGRALLAAGICTFALPSYEDLVSFRSCSGKRLRVLVGALVGAGSEVVGVKILA